MTVHEIEEVEVIVENDEQQQHEETRKYRSGELLGLRVLTTIALPFIIAFGAVSLAFAIIFALFRRETARKAWRFTCTASALATGCFVSIFSPRFGITLICAYFVLRADKHSNGALFDGIRSHFTDAADRF